MRNLWSQCACVAVAALVPGGSVGSAAQSTWLTQTTPHFEIFYERQWADRIDRVAVEAELAYSRIATDLRFDLPARVPLIVVPSERDLPKSRAAATALVVESGAPARDHLLLALDPSEQRQASLSHELTHHFTWELTPSDREAIPAWLDEGLSEYERVRWTGSPSPARTYSSVPAISQIASSDRDSSRRVFEFIADEYGTDGIRRYLTTLKHATTSGSALQETFGFSQDEFERAFQQYLRAH
jgi:hypothetical protein